MAHSTALMAQPARRAFLRSALAASALAGLTACTVTTNNGVTTVTLKVREVVTDTNVAITIIKTALGFTGIPAAIVTAVTTVLSTVSTALNAFESSAGDSVTLTFDTSNVPSALTTLIADLNTASATITSAATAEDAALSSALATKIAAISSDVANVAAILQSIISVTLSAPQGPSQAQRRAAQIQEIAARHGMSR